MKKIFLNIFMFILVITLCVGCVKPDDDNDEDPIDPEIPEQTILEVEEVKEQIIALVNSYKESLTGSINLKLTNANDYYNITLKYNLSSKTQITAYEYKVEKEVSGIEMLQYTYIKEGIVYSCVNNNLGTDSLDSDFSDYIFENCGVEVVLDSIIPFYEEDAFYNALVFSKSIDDETLEYKLNINNYKGTILDVSKKESITIEVTIVEEKIKEINLVVVSDGKQATTFVSFNGLEIPNITYPDNLN